MAAEKCSSCGYLLQPFDTECPKCRLATKEKPVGTEGPKKATPPAKIASAPTSAAGKPAVTPPPIPKAQPASPTGTGVGTAKAAGGGAVPAGGAAKGSAATGSAAKGGAAPGSAAEEEPTGLLTKLGWGRPRVTEQICSSCRGSFSIKEHFCPYCGHPTPKVEEEARGLPLETQRKLVGLGFVFALSALGSYAYYTVVSDPQALSYKLLGRKDISWAVETRLPDGNGKLRAASLTQFWARPGFLRIDTQLAKDPPNHPLTRIVDYEGRQIHTVDTVANITYSQQYSPEELRGVLYPSTRRTQAAFPSPRESTPALTSAGWGDRASNPIPVLADFQVPPAGTPPVRLIQAHGGTGGTLGASRTLKLENLGRAYIAGYRTTHYRLTASVINLKCTNISNQEETVEYWVANREPAPSLDPTPTPPPSSSGQTKPAGQDSGNPDANAPDVMDDGAFKSQMPGVPALPEIPTPAASGAKTPETPATGAGQAEVGAEAEPRAGGTPQLPTATEHQGEEGTGERNKASAPAEPPTPTVGAGGGAATPQPTAIVTKSLTPIPVPTPYPGELPAGTTETFARLNLDGISPQDCTVEDILRGKPADFSRLGSAMLMRVRYSKGKKVVWEQEVTSIVHREVPREDVSADAYVSVSPDQFWERRAYALAHPSPTPVPSPTAVADANGSTDGTGGSQNEGDKAAGESEASPGTDAKASGSTETSAGKGENGKPDLPLAPQASPAPGATPTGASATGTSATGTSATGGPPQGSTTDGNPAPAAPANGGAAPASPAKEPAVPSAD